MIETDRPFVFLYGNADRVDIVAQFCRAVGIRVKALVYSNGETQNRFGLPGVDVNELNQNPYDAQIPIVICNGPPTNLEDEFITAINGLKNNFRVPNPILHPSFLSEFIVTGKRRKLLLNGFPGSGNMIYQALIYDLLPNGLGDVPDQLERQLIKFNSEHFSSTRNLVERCMDIYDRQASHVYPLLRDQIGITMTMAGPELPEMDFDVQRLFVFSGLPGRSSSWTDIQGSHEAMDTPTLQFYRNRGFSILHFIRHPLDVLVSGAGKITSFKIQSETFQGNRRHASTLINNLEWFESMVEAIARYLELSYHNRSAMTIFRYEDLVDHPVETIQGIARAIGVEADQATAEELWARHGFKPLKITGVDHFWRPGREKWKEFMTERHLDIVRASSLPELMYEFGYSPDLSVDESVLQTTTDPPIPQPCVVSLKDYVWHTLTGKRWVIRDPDTHVAEAPELDANFVTNHAPLVETAGHLLRSSILAHVVRAARWHGGTMT